MRRMFIESMTMPNWINLMKEWEENQICTKIWKKCFHCMHVISALDLWTVCINNT